ncbi:MAG: hypothetical protein II370_08185, partial [Clostridia bacterium]|nr:hypothetical protein [Clostridia bacterium]
MKRILIGLLAALTVFSAASCAQSEEIAPSVTEPTVETAPVEITRYTEAERLVKGKTTAVTRDALAVPLSRKY